MKKELLNIVAVVLFTASIDNVLMQSVSWDLATSKPICKNSIRLTCTISDFPSCCSSLRTWKKFLDGVTTDLITIGVSTDASKYREDLNTAANQTTLIIENFDQDSDVTGIQYICGYEATSDRKYLVLTDDKDCPACAGKDYGLCILGTLIAAFVSWIIVKIRFTRITPLKALIVGGISALVGSILDIIIAVPSGLVWCHCYCKPGWMALFPFLGLLTPILPAVLLIYRFNRGSGASTSGSQGSCCPPCFVGPEPEEQTNRSPKRAHKTEKPVGVTRPQPAKPAQHIRTDNESSLEMVPKDRPLPPLTSPRPQTTLESDDIPQKRALPPLTSTTVEKKKKKKKKKNLDEEDNDD